MKLLQIGGVYLFLALHRGVVEMWHSCILWGETPLVLGGAVSGRISVTVHDLLQQYRKWCRAKRKRPREASESPPALLPISFALAKDWLPKQQKAQSEALETGVVNEEAREVVANPNRSLAEQPASTAALLEWPARPASPVVPLLVMSLGPEPVTGQVRAKEQAEERKRRQAQAAAQPDDKLHRKKSQHQRRGRWSLQSWRTSEAWISLHVRVRRCSTTGNDSFLIAVAKCSCMNTRYSHSFNF